MNPRMLRWGVKDLNQVLRNQYRQTCHDVVRVLLASTIVLVLLSPGPGGTSQGRVRSSAPFEVVNRKGKKLMAVREGVFGGGQLVIYDKDGRVSLRLDTWPSGGYLRIGNARGKTVVTLAASEGGGQFFLYSDGEKPVFRAP